MAGVSTGIKVCLRHESSAALRELAAKLPGVKDGLASALDSLVAAYNANEEGLGIAKVRCEEAIRDVQYVLSGIENSLLWLSNELKHIADMVDDGIAVYGEDPESYWTGDAAPSGMGGHSTGGIQNTISDASKGRGR